MGVRAVSDLAGLCNMATRARGQKVAPAREAQKIEMCHGATSTCNYTTNGPLIQVLPSFVHAFHREPIIPENHN
jgi:hypothetical protein